MIELKIVSRTTARILGAQHLEQHGYVERRPDPRNRRATLVCFTERGWDETDACARILDDLDEELISRVGASKLQQLQDLLTEVTDVLQRWYLSTPAGSEPPPGELSNHAESGHSDEDE